MKKKKTAEEKEPLENEVRERQKYENEMRDIYERAELQGYRPFDE